MEKPNMDELVARLKTEDAQRYADNAQRIEEQRQQLLEQKGRYVVWLEKMIADWLETMATAGYPGAKLLAIHSDKIKKGLFSSRVVGTHYEEAAGWPIARFISTLGAEYDDPGFIYLTVDGRLMRGNYGHLESPYQIGQHFVETEIISGHTQVGHGRYHKDEVQIPDNLKAIAEEAGVDWNPAEVAPNPQGT